MLKPFVLSAKLEIDARRAEAPRSLSCTRNGIPQRVLVLAQLKEILLTAARWGLRLAHIPPQFTVWCNRDTGTRIQKSASHAFVDWPAVHEDFHVILLFTMLRDTRGAWQVDDLATLVTNRHYVPVNSMSEAILAKHLIEVKRYFYKPMSCDADASRYPNFLLTDMGAESTPIEVCANDGAAAALRNARIADYQDRGMASSRRLARLETQRGCKWWLRKTTTRTIRHRSTNLRHALFGPGEMSEQQHQAFHLAIGMLPDHCRKAFVFWIVYAYSDEELAAHCGVSVETAMDHVKRGCQLLKELSKSSSR